MPYPCDDNFWPWPTLAWTPVIGCSPVGAGCEGCYAANQVMAAVTGQLRVGTGGEPVINEINKERKNRGGSAFSVSTLRPAVRMGTMLGVTVPVFTNIPVEVGDNIILGPVATLKPHVVFAFAHGDLYWDGVGERKRVTVFSVMKHASQHLFNVLTKRSKAMNAFDEKIFRRFRVTHPNNIRLGISATTQEDLDSRYDDLSRCCARDVIISLQPLREHLTLPASIANHTTGKKRVAVIVMAETGAFAPKFPLDPGIVADLRAQARALGALFYWETTIDDGPACLDERARASRDGDPYRTQEITRQSR